MGRATRRQARASVQPSRARGDGADLFAESTTLKSIEAKLDELLELVREKGGDD